MATFTIIDGSTVAGSGLTASTINTIKSLILAAAQEIDSYLVSANIDIAIELNFENQGNTTLATGGTGLFWSGTEGPGQEVWKLDSLEEYRTGTEIGGLNDPDISFTVNVDAVNAGDFFFDPDPSTRTANQPFSQYDFYSVALHELLHGFGFLAIVPGEPSNVDDNGPDVTPFDLQVDLVGGDRYFNGAALRAANGGNGVLLDGGDSPHLASINEGGIASIMNSSIVNGQRQYLSGIEIAMLSDLGYTLASATTGDFKVYSNASLTSLLSAHDTFSQAEAAAASGEAILLDESVGDIGAISVFTNNLFITGDSVFTRVDFQMASNVTTLRFGGNAYFDAVGNVGNDRITGNGQANVLSGGAGDDLLNGGDGNDGLFGNAGNDRLNGQGGNDSIDGNDGADLITGGIGDDDIDGGSGNDRLSGNSGDDFITGGDGSDLVFGGAGNDDIRAGYGTSSSDDTLYGQAGNDIISGQTGENYINGGGGDDRVFGGIGNDTIYGSIGVDILTGGDGNDFLHGGDQGDTVSGNDGDDTLYGYNGNDTLRGGTGNDFLQGGDNADTVNGNADNDTVRGGAGNDFVYGDAGDDALFGDDGADTLDGGTGNDTLRGGNGDDTLTGGAGNDRFDFATGWGDDTITDFANNGIEKINLFGVAGANALSDLTLTSVAGGTQIAFGGDTILVEGLSPSAFDAGDFIFSNTAAAPGSVEFVAMAALVPDFAYEGLM